jgi:hypothetical protein
MLERYAIYKSCTGRPLEWPEDRGTKDIAIIDVA